MSLFKVRKWRMYGKKNEIMDLKDELQSLNEILVKGKHSLAWINDRFDQLWEARVISKDWFEVKFSI